MKIELVSYMWDSSEKQRLSDTLDILNNSKSHLILFPGGTFDSLKTLEKLKIENKKTEAIIEVRNCNSHYVQNSLFRISKGKIINLNTFQFFAESKEIENNYYLGKMLLDELDTKRLIKVKNKNALILQCGEINILKNIQSQNNKTTFRLNAFPSLKAKFEKILQKSEIILNPIHTPMGNQGKMESRRRFLSKECKREGDIF